MKFNCIRLLLIILAGAVAVILTWFGFMDFAFSTLDQDNPIAVALIWILPLFSLPLLVTYWIWKGMRPVVFWAFVAGQWATLSWFNWESCLRKGCTTSNPVLIVLSAGIIFPVWLWIVIAGLRQYEHHLRSRDESHPSKSTPPKASEAG
jgi:hypothetical protein